MASAPRHEKLPKSPREKPSATLFVKPLESPRQKSPEPQEKPSEQSLEQIPLPARRQKKTKSAIYKALKREDEKYEGIDFDVLPPTWSNEDKRKMRKVMRSMSIGYKNDINKERISKMVQQVRYSGPVETALAREIIGLLQKDNNLMNYMDLKHVAFSTFSRNTYDWDKVAELMDNKHTPAECKEYWYMELYPRVKNMGFSEANDKQLMELAIENKYQNWDKVADKIIGHTEFQCYVHFRRNLIKKIQKPKEKQSIQKNND